MQTSTADPALRLLTDAIAFEKAKLRSREWSPEITEAVEAKIKSYQDAISAREAVIKERADAADAAKQDEPQTSQHDTVEKK